MQTSMDTGPGDYRVLAAQVRDAGLMDRRSSYYRWKILLTVAAYAAGWASFVAVGNSWATLGVAALLGVLFTQVVFLAHDAGHLQISCSHRINRLVGLVVGDLLTGLSFGWWVPKHNAHHAHPNQIDRDPDIGPGVLAFAFTPDMARAGSIGRGRGRTRLLTRWQAWLFFPLLLIEGAGLHITSVDALVRRRDRSAAIEGALLVGHAAVYLSVVFTVLSPGRAFAFMAVQQGIFGLYLGCTFAPNHKGMPLLERDAGMSFLRRQVITARNVRGGRLIHFVMGGLNYQIEHHLFPTMPRPNLASAQTIVREFCSIHGLPYREDGLTDSYRVALQHLQAVAKGRDTYDGAVSSGSERGDRAGPDLDESRILSGISKQRSASSPRA